MPAREPPDRDPLDAVLRPPIDETAEEKAFRVAQEEEARRISQAIDDSIRQERQQRKKMKVVRLLLLGQSESGKSTTLRQFQRLYTPSAFREERVLWRSIIQLNLVRSVHTILDALADVRLHELPAPPSPMLSPTSSYSPFSPSASLSPAASFSPASPFAYSHSHGHPHPHGHAHVARAATVASDSDADTDSADAPALPAHLLALRVRLAPLRDVEALLIAKLVPPPEDGAYPTPRARGDSTGEVFVRPGAGWKRAMRLGGLGRPYSAGAAGQETADEVQGVLSQCRVDLVALWRDPMVRGILRKRKIRLEESPGFFLDDLERVTALKYLPSDDDVLKARLKTVGVSEYRFEMEAGSESGTQWRIIDVGGSRSQRRECPLCQSSRRCG
ncbi:hypothetical protein AcV7_001673 [Taiwanofungus camphoratus]|nr:hypothetical protein AcV7_001673 [Antrodia cinnamomea]